jgi:hypothetical protein
LITLAMSAVVAAPRASIWSALGDPAQALHWRPGAIAVLPPTPGELLPGRVLRLRCVLGAVPIVLEERALEVSHEERLRSELRLGLFRCEETFTLAAADPDGGHTRVGLRHTAPSEAPLVGGSLDRFGVRRFATELASGSLAALREWCERAGAARPGNAAPLESREVV